MPNESAPSSSAIISECWYSDAHQTQVSFSAPAPPAFFQRVSPDVALFVMLACYLITMGFIAIVYSVRCSTRTERKELDLKASWLRIEYSEDAEQSGKGEPVPERSLS